MSIEEQLTELTRGVVDLHVKEDLIERLKLDRPLVVKAGFDPTRPDLHLGHTVLMSKMKQFQDFGHEVVFIVGDFTASIGDPSGRKAARPVPTREEIEEGARTYAEQAFKVLDRERTRIVYNSQWLEGMQAADVVKLMGKHSLAQIMEREDFKMRWANQQSISLHELLYPVIQAYDSVELNCDVELGGTDQLFNLMVGRKSMREFGRQPQIVMTTPLLMGTSASMQDGELVGAKMSKSLDNYVGVDEPAGEQFGKLMSISDEAMWHYYELLSTKSSSELTQLRADLAAGAAHPKQVKVDLAIELVSRFHGAPAAEKAQADFEAQFSRREVPEDMPQVELTSEPNGLRLTTALVLAGLVQTKSDGRRRIQQAGVQIDGVKISDVDTLLHEGGPYVVKAGKRAWASVTVKPPSA